AIFTHDQKDSSTELAFKYAVYKINKEKIILPKTTLEYDIQYVPKDDSFHASKKVEESCKMLRREVRIAYFRDETQSLFYPDVGNMHGRNNNGYNDIKVLVTI
ncbi:Glutamate receptor, ionotropic kainate 1, partial [Harpegnathos saltator]